MALDLEWELHAFKGLMALWRRLRPTPPPPFAVDRVAHLAPLLPRLVVVARAIAEAPVQVAVGRGAGGVRGLDVLVPAFIDVLPSPEANEALCVLRVAFGAAMVRVLDARAVAAGHRIPIPDDALARVVLTLDVAADACDLLTRELAGAGAALDEALSLRLSSTTAPAPTAPPMTKTKAAVLSSWQDALRDRPWRAPGVVEAWRRLPGDLACAPLLLVGELLGGADDHGGKTAGPDESEGAGERPAPTTTMAATPLAAVRRTLLDQIEQQKTALMHTFEKVESLDTFNGQARDGDGSDELSLHAEALQEVDLRDMVRGGEQARGLLQAEVSLDADVPDVGQVLPGERGLPYDEWDHRQRAYRPDWCTVYEGRLQARDAAAAGDALARHRRVVGQLHDELSRLRHDRRPKNRELDGPDIDIDAVIDDIAARQAGSSGSGRLYARRERHRPALSTTVLLDVSLSSDAWVDGRRVLDVAREIVIVLGEVSSRLGEPFEVLAFASETRNHCRVWDVARHDEPWTVGRERLFGLRPQGYTRIGPALRHAQVRAARLPAARKLVLLVSDGKPTDYDRYEGRYGVADVRQALREGAQRGVLTHALAIDSHARSHLPEMFGTGAWHVLSHADRLLEVMRSAWGRLVR